jgi:hypothetical protein
MDEQAVIAKLNEALRILTEEIPTPDMDVVEWSKTPIGRAVDAIGEAIDLIVDDD